MDNYKKIGEVPPVSAREAGDTVWGLGFEKLDRAVFDPEKAYDKVAELGVRHIRIQSGWARSEKTKGIYEFEWLDEIVNNLIQRGLEPWICLCYGNGLYDEAARKVFGAVGCPPIQTEQQRQAWSNYVTALTAHFLGQVSRYEIWNEPDGRWCWKHGVSGAEYGEFAKATAAAIRKGDPDAEVIGGAVCLYNFSWLTEMFETGVAESLDAISYHAYLPDEFRGIANIRSLKSLSLRYNPKLRFIQGETGTQSREGGAGALHEGAWTPEKQAKFLARMLLIHFAEGVEINSYFSCLDMIEALNGKVGEKASYLDYGYFGVLGAEFDADGRSTGEYRPKPAYRTLQTLAAIFRGELIAEELPVRLLCDQLSPRLMRNDDSEKNELLTFGYRKKQGAGFVYWKPVELLTTTYASTISLEVAGVEGEPRLVDLLDGTIYAIPESAIEITGKNSRRFLHLPLRDYPLLLSFGNFIG